MESIQKKQKQVGHLRLKYPAMIESIRALPYPDDMHPSFYQMRVNEDGNLNSKLAWKQLVSHIKEQNFSDWGFYGLDIPYLTKAHLFDKKTDLTNKYSKKSLQQLFSAYQKQVDIRTDSNIAEALRLEAARKMTRYGQVLLKRRYQLYSENPLNFLRIAWHYSLCYYERELASYRRLYPNVKKKKLFAYKNMLRLKHHLPIRANNTNFGKKCTTDFIITEKMNNLNQELEDHAEANKLGISLFEYRKKKAEEQRGKERLLEEVLEVENLEEEEEEEKKRLLQEVLETEGLLDGVGILEPEVSDVEKAAALNMTIEEWKQFIDQWEN